MPTGTVKWFNNAKGFGFILSSDREEDIFVHYSAINMDGYRTLKAGQQVNFELEDGDRGKHAINIQLCESSEPAGSDQAVLESPSETTQETSIETPRDDPSAAT